jgi:PAS domain-containing protein
MTSIVALPIAIIVAAALALAVLGQLRRRPGLRELALDTLAEAIIVLDARGRLRLANRAARELLGDILHDPERLARLLRADLVGGAEAWQKTIQLGEGGRARWLEARADPVHNGWGERAGRVLRLADVTATRASAAERAHLVTELQRALGDVSSLRGLLPICPDCKRVRDDQGYWLQVEGYLGKAAQLSFTHSICPECYDKLYRPYIER